MQWKNYRFEECDQGLILVEYLPEESEESIEIPSMVNGKPVIAIGTEAFADQGMLLASIRVPGTVKTICEGAFKMCMSLTEVVLLPGVEVIEKQAFYLTPLEEIYLPETVRILEAAWELDEIRFSVAENNPWFFTDGAGLYHCYEGQQELLVVQQQEERACYRVADGTTIIGENAFSGNDHIETIVLPESMRIIRNAALESCQKLTRLELNEGLVEMHTHAVSHCIRLKELHLPSTLRKLQVLALSDTFGWSDTLNGLERITVHPSNPAYFADENGLYEIVNPVEGKAADISKMESRLVKYFGHDRHFDLPNGLVAILPSALRRGDFHSVSIPASVSHVGKDAFKECKSLEWMYLAESNVTLYVPRMPVYRKDEITALLNDSEDLAKPKAVPVGELPEKWKDFFGHAIYDKNGQETDETEYLFDYRGYDGLFHTYLNVPDHIGMACCRLKYPVLLGRDVEAKYRQFFRENLTEVMESIAQTDDLDHLAELSQLEIIDRDNIETCIEILNVAGKTKLLGFLLSFKQEHLGEDEFDFSL